MTALSQLIILQGKDSDPALLLFESAAILMISLACVAIGYHQKNAELRGNAWPGSG